MSTKYSKLSERIKLFQTLNKVTNTYALSNYGWVMRWHKKLKRWDCRKWPFRKAYFNINGKQVFINLSEKQMQRALLTAGK